MITIFMHHSDAPCRPLVAAPSFVRSRSSETCARAAARSVGEGAAPARLRACHQCRQPSIGRARAPHRTRARATRCHVMTHNPYAISYPCRTMNTWRKCCTPDALIPSPEAKRGASVCAACAWRGARKRRPGRVRKATLVLRRPIGAARPSASERVASVCANASACVVCNCV